MTLIWSQYFQTSYESLKFTRHLNLRSLFFLTQCELSVSIVSISIYYLILWIHYYYYYLLLDRTFFSHPKALEQRDIKIPGLLALLQTSLIPNVCRPTPPAAQFYQADIA